MKKHETIKTHQASQLLRDHYDCILKKDAIEFLCSYGYSVNISVKAFNLYNEQFI